MDGRNRRDGGEEGRVEKVLKDKNANSSFG